jgi:hypothetical protein
MIWLLPVFIIASFSFSFVDIVRQVKQYREYKKRGDSKYWNWDWDDTAPLIFLSGLICAVSVGLWIWTSALSFGCNPNYGRGEIEGYVNHSGSYGLVWKTNEFNMQLQNNYQTTLSEFRFSVPDKTLSETLKAMTGKRIKLHYRQWFIMPFKFGQVDKEAISFEMIP